jgi:hypothetical protein
MSSTSKQIIVIDGKKYEVTGTVNFAITPIEGPPVPDPEPGPKPVPEPVEKGTVLHGGWGGNKDPKSWSVVPMKDDPKQFKVVDDEKTNIATNFSSKDSAEKFIQWSITNTVPPTPGPDPNPPPTPGPAPTPTGDKDQFGITKICPDGGATVTDFVLEEKERHYASGAPSEWSVEYTNDNKSKWSDLEFTYYVKINGFKDEADNISTKVLGPNHTDGPGRSWYISEVATDGSSKKTMMTEIPHPKYFENSPKAEFTIGESLIGKWLGIKVITYLINGGKDRRIETYLDYPVADIKAPPNKWRRYWSVDDTGQLDHAHFIQPTGSLAVCRIDGVKKGDPPNFAYASVRQIKPPQ